MLSNCKVISIKEARRRAVQNRKKPVPIRNRQPRGLRAWMDRPTTNGSALMAVIFVGVLVFLLSTALFHRSRQQASQAPRDPAKISAPDWTE